MESVSARLPIRSKFSAVGLIVWLSLATIIGVAIAALAFAAAQVAAPLGLFPLLVGGLLGGSLVLAMRIAQIGYRPTIQIGTLLAALVVVIGQHYASYLNEKQHAAQAREKFNEKIASSAVGISPELFTDHLPNAPANFAEYMQQQAIAGRPITAQISLRGPYAWTSWTLDGFLQCAAAILIVWWAARLPYCGRCGTWYRTVRKGSISDSTAMEIDAASLGWRGDQKSLQYRLKCCVGGCGPTQYELSGTDSTGHFRSTAAWFSADARDRVSRILDAAHR